MNALRMIRNTAALVAVCALLPAPGLTQQPAPTLVPTLSPAAPAAEAGAPLSRDVTFPLLGVTVHETKSLLPGGSHGTAVDQFGHSVDLGQLQARERMKRALTPIAKLAPPLRAALERDPQGTFPIVIWLAQDPAPLAAIRSQFAAALEAADGSPEKARELESATTPIVMAEAQRTTAAFLAAAGQTLEIRYVSTSAPVVFANATQVEVMELAARNAVDTIYLETADRHDHNVNANKTHRTDRVHQLGVRGRNVRVAMLEDNGIDPACPYLNVAGWFNAANPHPDNHIHGSSGCVASQLVSRLGAAPDVQLFSANAASYSDTNVTAAADWIAANNMDITNMSFGGNYAGAMQYLDRYFDYQSRNYFDSYVASAGNDGPTLANAWVGSPASAWNVISVGAHTDGGNGDWTGDVMSSFSSYRNPLTGCQKPNLAANGQDIDTLGQGPGWLTNGYDGTSFSAPHTSGNLADSMVVNGNIIGYPEAAMALLMATAWHNIEGATTLSDQDGAGGLNGLAAYRAAKSGHVLVGALNSGSFTTNGYAVRNIYLQGGDRTRVCFAWSSNANSAYTTDVLDADLDISIYGGQNQTSGTYYGGSASFNNNFEIVEFTPPATGWYTVAINDYRFDGTNEYYGLVYSQKYADTSEFRLREWTPETSNVSGPTMGNQNYYMDFQAPNSANDTFICVPGATLGGTGFGFSAQTWSPLTPDAWTDLWFQSLSSPLLWFGFNGTLDGNGVTYGNRMYIPDAPFLIGYELYHVGFTFEAGYADTVKEVSEVHSFKFWPTPHNETRSDDGSVLINLPFTFRFYGVDYTQVYLNMNGNLTFGSPMSTFGETPAGFLGGQPKIAALWDDLNPSANGSQGTPLVRTRTYNSANEGVVIEWINVPEYSVASSANTVRLTLAGDNTITIEYLDCSLQDCIVGVSPGNNLSAAAEVDISKSGNLTSAANGALYEVFTGAADPFDLGSSSIYYNTVRFVPTSSTATAYRLDVDLN